jgi:hypothetical protein
LQGCAWSAAPQCGHAHIITIAALGCGAPRRIPAKSVNYFYGNMKDVKIYASLLIQACNLNHLIMFWFNLAD